MFIDPTSIPRPALQRSAIFHQRCKTPGNIALPWSENEFFSITRSINIPSLRDQGKPEFLFFSVLSVVRILGVWSKR